MAGPNLKGLIGKGNKGLFALFPQKIVLSLLTGGMMWNLGKTLPGQSMFIWLFGLVETP